MVVGSTAVVELLLPVPESGVVLASTWAKPILSDLFYRIGLNLGHAVGGVGGDCLHFLHVDQRQRREDDGNRKGNDEDRAWRFVRRG